MTNAPDHSPEPMTDKIEGMIQANADWLAKRAPASPPTPEPMNQCDGCRRGLALIDGIHHGRGYDLIACTEDRYPPASPPDQTPERPMSQSIEGFCDEWAIYGAARSALLTRYKELEAEKDAALDGAKEYERERNEAGSRIAELEAELIEERKIGMRLTPGKLPEEKWDY